MILTPGGASEEESTDGDSQEECQEDKVTGISEDTKMSWSHVEEREETGSVLETTGESSVSRKEETNLPTETWIQEKQMLTLQDTLMWHGRIRSNPSNHMLPNTIESGVSMKKETEWKLDSELQSNNLSASLIKM